MSAIIMRSALVFHGLNPAPNVAYVVSDRFGKRAVTWAEVIEARRQRQRKRLAEKRACEQRRAVKVWVAYFDTFVFGGWQAFVTDWRGRGYQTWVDRDGKGLKDQLMRLFPMTLFTDWETWKEAFAKRYCRCQHDGKPLGVAFAWRRGWLLEPLEEA